MLIVVVKYAARVELDSTVQPSGQSDNARKHTAKKIR